MLVAKLIQRARQAFAVSFVKLVSFIYFAFYMLILPALGAAEEVTSNNN